MSSNNALQEYFSRRFRSLLSGAPDGIPPWVGAVGHGDEPGLYMPGDAPWIVHRDFATLVGGIRALLMQALHPAALTGVRDHSRYQQDPLGRLSGTIQWLTTTTFASVPQVRQEAQRVNRMHRSVSGSFRDGDGAVRSYSAGDTEFLLWVHVAFMESFLVAHQCYADAKIPRGQFETGGDNYVSQWSQAVTFLGLKSAPQSVVEMNELIDDYLDSQKLCATTDTHAVVGFIRHPPLPRAARPIYRLLFNAAVSSIRPEFRKILGLRAQPRYIVVPLTKLTLRTLRAAVGPRSPVEEAALDRLRRIGALD